jgi:hypothetical protein
MGTVMISSDAFTSSDVSWVNPKWETLIPAKELECPDYIKYCIYGCYSQCRQHGQAFISVNAMNVEYCMECIRIPITKQDGRKIQRMQKKYIRQENTEPMNEFMALGSTYHTHIMAMLYNSFLIVMLGSTMLAKAVVEVVKTDDYNLLFWRDHSKRYTPQQTGEIMSEKTGVMVMYPSKVQLCFTSARGRPHFGRSCMQVCRMIRNKMHPW